MGFLTRVLKHKNFLRINSRLITQSIRVQTTEEPPKFDEHAPNQENLEEPIETRILRNALKYVPQYGFTNEALAHGSAETGYSNATISIFKNGPFDLIDFFYKDSNKKLELYLEDFKKDGKKFKITEFIRMALVYRLTLTQPYIMHWPQAMAIMTFNPTYALETIDNLLRLVDEIWYQAGDTSTDYNWYTKRLTLAAIYKSTEYFMIQDKSENYEETWKFLDNRFNDLRSFSSIKGNMDVARQFAVGSVTVLKNIMNTR